MAHRSAREPLRERREVILNRLAALEIADDADDERAALLRALDEVRMSLEQITPPRAVLQQLRLVRGCEVSWESMVGDARVRHCGACDREVFDLTAMDPDEVEAFVLSRRANLPCLRMHVRPDGRYQDGPCEPAQRRMLKRALFAAITLGLTGILGVLSADPGPTEARPPEVATPNRFDAHWFREPTSYADVPSRGRVALTSELLGAPALDPVTPYARELDALEATFWASPPIVRATLGAERGFLTLTVTVGTNGRLTAEVFHASEGFETIARRAARAASRVRTGLRPSEPVVSHWYRAFR